MSREHVTRKLVAPIALGLVGLTVLIAPVVAIRLYDVLSWQGQFPTDVRAFSPAAWNDPTIARRDMCDDLVENHLRDGMTRAEVLSLLGQPQEEGGAFLSFDIGWHWLTVDFDDDQRLDDVDLSTY